MKCYRFTAEMSCTGTGYVYAEDEDEAREKILNRDYEDINDTSSYEIEDVVEIEFISEED